MLDTLCSLYRRTYFRIKSQGLISAPILNKYGVTEGGNVSPTLNRNYLPDLGDYLTHAYGLCMSETIVAHLLWADDLILISDSHEGLQKQLDGVETFCTKTFMIVNELKTKVMAFGKCDEVKVHCNEKIIERVTNYNYLGNIITLRILRREIYSVTTMTTCSVKHKKPFYSEKQATTFRATVSSINVLSFRWPRATNCAVWEWCIGPFK